MKKLILILCAASALAQVRDTYPRTPVVLTVATLPASPATNTRATISDGASATDCTTGGGSTVVDCRYTGSAWTAAPGGSGSGTVTEVQAGTGITVANGTTTPTVSADLSVLPSKATAAGTPTMAGQLTGSVAVDTSASPDRFYFCGADDGTDCTAVIRIGGYAEMLPLAGGTLTGQLITDNLGIEFEESDTNPTCAAGNYNIYADLSETKLKACQNGVASDLVGSGGTGTTHQIFMNLAGNTVASTTSYAGPSAASFGTETARAFLVTRDTTFTKMYLRTSGTQGACDATVTLRNTSTAADTAITFTIANGATTQTFSDTAHTAAFTAGQRAVVKVASTGCTSATITEISLEYN